MCYWIVDRLEGDFVILEAPQGSFVRVSQASFSGALAQEGDVCRQNTDGSFSILPEETEKRRKKLAAIQKKIFEKR